MRLVIDMQGAQTDSRFRGIGRYTTNLVRTLIANHPDLEVILALFGNLAEGVASVRTEFAGLLPESQIIEWHAPQQQINDTWARECGELIRSAFLQSLNPDWVIVTSLFEGLPSLVALNQNHDFASLPTAVIVYDLIPATNPKEYLSPSPPYEEDYNRKLATLSIADVILTISNHSKNEIVKYGSVPKSKVINISAATDPKQIPEKALDCATNPVLDSLKGRPFIFYSGGFDARKNVSLLVKAYGLLESDIREANSLVLAGKISGGVKQELISLGKRMGLRQDELIFTGYLADERLFECYSNCKLFVFPSHHEGFGLTPLEAMSTGVPVIGSNTSSIPEVIGLEDALFNPEDPENLSSLMLEVLTNDMLADKLKYHSRQRAATFSWRRTSSLLLETLTKTHSVKQKRPHVRSEKIIKTLIQLIGDLDGRAPSDHELLSIASQIDRSINENHLRGKST